MNERTKNLLFFMSGLAVGAALPVIVPAVIEGGRPLAKALLKHSALAMERLQVTAARATEWVEDLFAEVRSEGAPVAVAPEPPISMPSEPITDKKVLS
jgi:Protein of unknown function (DUF5132)